MLRQKKGPLAGSRVGGPIRAWFEWGFLERHIKIRAGRRHAMGMMVVVAAMMERETH